MKKAAEKTATLACSDITLFFEASSRGENDAANKKREEILVTWPPEFMEDPVHGERWRTVKQKWHECVGKIASDCLGLSADTSYTVKKRGGRAAKYDMDITYRGGHVAKVEFKFGCASINSLPQFLSLPAGTATFLKGPTYDQWFYDSGVLDRMLACDPAIGDKPARAAYLKGVRCVTPKGFFKTLHDREHVNTAEKTRIVDDSIRQYLREHVGHVDATDFAEKASATQSEKIYALWCNGQFHLDSFSASDFEGITCKGVTTTGNTLELVSGDGSTVYRLLLRWRNHKGISNPAWQISVKRTR